MERVRVEAQPGDRQALAADLGGELAAPRRPTGSRRRCARSRRSGGSGRSCAASRRSRCLEAVGGGPVDDLHRAASRGTARSAGRASSRRPPGTATRRPAIDVHPATAPGALGDRVVDEHLVVAVGEGGIGGSGGRPARRPRRRRWPGTGPRTCRRSPRRDRPAAPPPPGRPAHMRAGFLIRISFGRSRWPSQIWSGFSESQAIGAVGAVDLPLERVLPAGADLRHADRAAGAVLEAEQDRRRVLGLIARVTVSAERSVENVSTGPVGSSRTAMNVARSAITATIRWPVTNVIRSSQCEPMSPTARSAPPRSGSQPPVPVTGEEEPVLEVAAGHQPDLAERSGRDDVAGVLVERVVADVEVDRVDAGRSPRPRRPARADSAGRQRQGLLADDVAAGGQDRRRLADVEVVGGGDVDDVDRRVGEQLVERRVGAWRRRGPSARAAPRSGVLPRTPRTWTPMRRSASTWTVPMKPVPITAAPMSAILLVMPGSHLRAGSSTCLDESSRHLAVAARTRSGVGLGAGRDRARDTRGVRRSTILL